MYKIIRGGIFMVQIIHVNKNNFEKEILQAEETVLVDFWAPWCMPCKMFANVLEELAKEDIANFKICKINVDEDQKLAKKYNVMSIPTILIVKNGQIIRTEVGMQSKEHILSIIE